jgi:putative glutamine amidotransferase
MVSGFKRPSLAGVVLALIVTVVGCQAPDGPGRPLIGITSVYEVPEQDEAPRTTVSFAYVEAVADNGGIPLVLPTIGEEPILATYLEVLDGLVLVGGDDIPPQAYGEQPHETVEPLPEQRYDFERKLIARWLASGKPLLGVCLGMQFTSVVAGGTMVQDIPSEIGAEVDHRAYHRVEIEPGSLLAELLEAREARVLSNHHQAVDDVPQGFRVIARSADGVTEALERTEGGFGLFVQWHPEAMADRAHRDAIYGALVRAARQRTGGGRRRAPAESRTDGSDRGCSSPTFLSTAASGSME